MARSRVLAMLAPRQTLSSGNGDDDDNDEYCNNYGCYSSWNNWGRWVALVVIIVAIILIAFTFSCINSRRRRRRGMTPMYGTGWMAKPPVGNYFGNGQNYYAEGGHYGYGQPAPPYSPPTYPPFGNQMTGNTFNSNEGYYGHHGNNDFELQQPQTAYQPQRGGDPVYDAPEGPPPKKGDVGIIR